MSAIVPCKSIAEPFKGSNCVRSSQVDRLIDGHTTVDEFHGRLKNLSKYQFTLSTGGYLRIHPLAQAAIYGNVPVLLSIFKEGGPALLELGDLYGRIPLFLAVQFQQYEVAEKLISWGSPINVKHTSVLLKLGATPLSTAFQLNAWAIAKLLLRYGGAGSEPVKAEQKTIINKLNEEIAEERSQLASAIDDATDKDTFPLEMRKLIAEYAY